MALRVSRMSIDKGSNAGLDTKISIIDVISVEC